MAIYKIRPDEPESNLPTVMMKCPACDKKTPRFITDRGTDEQGTYQTMTCAVATCRHPVRVYEGEDGKDFQANVDTL